MKGLSDWFIFDTIPSKSFDFVTGTYNNEIDIVRCTVKLCTMSGNLLIVFVCLQCTLETTPI